MTSYPPPPPVRKLTRSRTDKMLGGVCSGVAKYLNMDVTLVRILTVVLSLFTGIPIIAYIVILLVVPEEEAPPYVGPQTVHVPKSATDPGPAAGDPVWGAEGAPWDQSGEAPKPTAEPGPAPQAPNEADPAPEEPLPESDPAHPGPAEASTWESAPADPGTDPAQPENPHPDKPEAKPSDLTD